MQCYTLEKYLEVNGFTQTIDATKITDHEDLSDALSEATDGELWAYPVEEMDYCKNEGIKVVLVTFPNDEQALAEYYNL